MISDAAVSESGHSGRIVQILARQDRIDAWALPWSCLAIVGSGYFFTFYDITDIGFAMPQIQTQFHLSDNETTFLTLAIGLIGYAVGSSVRPPPAASPR
jgi:putative MFS transporter